jgi:hypothetical protein
VKGKRNLFKNQVFLLMEISKWVVLICRWKGKQLRKEIKTNKNQINYSTLSFKTNR